LTETITFIKAVAESGIPHTTPHDLRHTAASLAVSAGANVKAVQKMLGHARIRESVGKMWARGGAPTDR
jgi:integrase